MQLIVIIGAAGDGRVLATTLEHCERMGLQKLIGFLDDGYEVGCNIGGATVLGRLEDWPSISEEVCFLPALHKIKQMPVRARLISSLAIPHERWASVVDPTARVASTVSLGVGVFIGPNVVIQSGARIGDHVSIRAGANIGHDAKVSNFCYVGPNSTLCGHSVMGEGSHLGPNACIVDNQTLGEFSVVGACSAVTKSLPSYAVYFGVPATKVANIAPHS